LKNNIILSSLWLSNTSLLICATFSLSIHWFFWAPSTTQYLLYMLIYTSSDMPKS
jgi:hypothetical protein